MKSLLTTILCLFLFISYGQDSGTNSDSEGFEAKMIQTSRMHMEYMDFGGKGNVLIHIQGVHNASALKYNLSYFQNYVAWRDILSKASEHYRVYSPIYRGYGNSDKEGDDIYNVENIAKDIMAFMDEMKIDRATFIGRTTAPQVMFYLAENHPNRVDAIVVSDNSMYKTVPIHNDEIKEFMYYCSYAAMDLGDRAPDIVMPSYDYEPIFYTDESKKIDIPLYWPYSEEMNIVKMNLSLLNYLQPNNSFIPNEMAKKYFDNLYADKELQNRIKQYYAENDPTQKNMDALKNAFGNNLTLQNIDEIEGANFMEKFKKADELMLKYLISVSKED
ncbi:alpha/beta fold hydrolase [Winogradskyella aquimaris]|uniref:Alpha/beta fold hydrolase n=1 Tax=Winogradskyella aquimaris TaxID=864074 RepID=A0ABU5EPX2_9FLAO|nr:alpha/beta fold hydrolase [Winogradskyella aquimaris]MDY2588112.1 alpha/beta fold hydrolase [Winogradskyella aquimaris]